MKIPAKVAVALCVVVVAGTSLGASQGTAKAAPKLPPAIETAFKAAYPNATIKAVSKEKYAGKDAYEVESVENGKARDLIYRTDGTVAVIEEEIALANLPPAVAAAIKKDFPTAIVTRYERAVEGGVTSYEVQLKGGKSGEYTAAGKRK